MDEKPIEGEAEPRITRSRARHIRRKRLLSARRKAENDSSVVTNIVAKNSKSSENHPIEVSLSKSKARRLRKRNKTKNVVETLDENFQVKANVVDSPSRLKKSSAESAQVAQAQSKLEIEFSSVKDEIDGEFASSEHVLFENEKNRKISENSVNIAVDQRRANENCEFGESSNFMKNDFTNSRIIEKIETTRIDDRAKESTNRIRETSLIREKKISSMSASGGTSDDVATTNLTTSERTSGTMNYQEKTREQVKAEREAKKAAKAASKSKLRSTKPEVTSDVASYESRNEISGKKFDSSRCDVVDGEILLPKIEKIAISLPVKDKPEVIDRVGNCGESRDEGKKKFELRAERRAKQEAQRAAKQATVKLEPKVVDSRKETAKISGSTGRKIDETRKIVTRTILVKENIHEVNLFKHLYYEREQALVKVPIVHSNIHPAIVRLGVQYADKVIVGSNARCVALLAAVKRLVKDFERPPQADFNRGFEASLQESSAYLHHCRPLAVSMKNALRHLKAQMAQLSTTMSDDEAKTKLENAIDKYIQERIQLADKAISIKIQTKISNGDVILTYGYSSLICKILCDAHDAGRQFRVVVVDGRPWLEGREQLRRLAKHGLECSYVLINALSFIMPQVSNVFLGAHAALANGAVISRVGTAQVALMAKSFNVPVLVACETHKMCERTQTDSIVYNEIANPDELAKNPMGIVKKTSLINWRGKKFLNLLNITYDVTPADLISTIVTELGMLPCSSVPGILRIKASAIEFSRSTF